MASGIEWTTETWNPVVGCSRVSEGCTHCYAEQMAGRLKKMGVDQYQDVVHQPEGVDEWRWTGDIEYAEHRLSLPLEWKEPRRVFVDSMSDLFHPAVDFEYIAAVFGVMAAAPDHTFQILTKRPDRMQEFLTDFRSGYNAREHCAVKAMDAVGADQPLGDEYDETWPLPNVWIGVSVEDQDAADERIPPLLECPAAVRFVSAEPLLGRLRLNAYLSTVKSGHVPAGPHGRVDPQSDHDCPTADDVEFGEWCGCGLDWIIVGGESGPGARACDLNWIRSIRDQCETADVPCFIKQLGGRPAMNEVDADDGSERLVPVDSDGWGEWLDDPKGGDADEWPEGLRVREFPEEAGGV